MNILPDSIRKRKQFIQFGDYHGFDDAAWYSSLARRTQR
jgi:hypothetical protein